MSKPKIRELLDKIGSYNNGSTEFVLAERVEAVLKLHQLDPGGPDYEDACTCDGVWPCATVRALDGEQP